MTKFDRFMLYAVEIYALVWFVAKLFVAVSMLHSIYYAPSSGSPAMPHTAPHQQFFKGESNADI